MTPFPIRVLGYLLGDKDPLAGDLTEEYTRGRSSVWMWRQVIAAIVFGELREIGKDPWRAAGAFAVLGLLSRATFDLLVTMPHPFAWWIFEARTPRPSATMVLSDVLSVTVLCALSAWVGGSIAGRLSIFMFVGLVLALVIPASIGTVPLLSQAPVSALVVLSTYSILVVFGVGAGTWLAVWLAGTKVRT